jgi:hypothetical protein
LVKKINSFEFLQELWGEKEELVEVEVIPQPEPTPEPVVKQKTAADWVFKNHPAELPANLPTARFTFTPKPKPAPEEPTVVVRSAEDIAADEEADRLFAAATAEAEAELERIRRNKIIAIALSL